MARPGRVQGKLIIHDRLSLAVSEGLTPQHRVSDRHCLATKIASFDETLDCPWDG